MLRYDPGRRGSADSDGKAHQFYTNGIHPYLPELRDRKRAERIVVLRKGKR